jgi:glycogen operon protein
MMVSHGTPMLFGGDEWMRTQLGNNNAYSSGADNPFNWFDWGVWQAQDERHRMHDFVRKATRLRAERRYAFAPEDYGRGAPFAWKNERGEEPPDWSQKRLMVHYHDPSFGPEIAILVNGENLAEGECIDFVLPAGRAWRRLVDTQAYFDQPDTLAAIGADPRLSQNITLDDPPPGPPPPNCAHGPTTRVRQTVPDSGMRLGYGNRKPPWFSRRSTRSTISRCAPVRNTSNLRLSTRTSPRRSVNSR